MKELRQTKNYSKYMQAIGWETIKVQGVYCYAKNIPILGKIIKIQRPEKFSVSMYQYIDTKFKPFQIILEPKYTYHVSRITSLGFLQTTPYVPSKTIHIDLTKSQNKLLSEMHHKTRYNIKKHINQIKIKKSKDIEKFANFWQSCSRHRLLFLSQKKEITSIYKSFDKNADLLLAYSNKELVGGLLLVSTENIAYYMYAASSAKGKTLFAPTLLVWKALKQSKLKGYKIFDFEGIYDNRFPLNSWLGFTRFKKSFGGKTVKYPSAFKKTKLRLL